MLKVGDRILVVGKLNQGRLGLVTGVLNGSSSYGDYKVQLQGGDWCVFKDQELVSIPQGSTFEQIKALREILCCR